MRFDSSPSVLFGSARVDFLPPPLEGQKVQATGVTVQWASIPSDVSTRSLECCVSAPNEAWLTRQKVMATVTFLAGRKAVTVRFWTARRTSRNPYGN